MSDTSHQNESIRSVIDRRAAECPDSPFLVNPDEQSECTYAQLQSLCIEFSNQVLATGVSPGSSVAYAMNNGLAAAVTVLGLQYGGFRAVAINLVAGRDIIGYVLAHSETELIVTQTALIDDIKSALNSNAFTEDASRQPTIFTLSDANADEMPCFHWASDIGDSQAVLSSSSSSSSSSNSNASSNAHAELASAAGKAAELTSNTDGLLMYTSGTTGRPKGVVLSHGNLLAGGQNVCVGHELSDSDRALCVLPLFHINGLCVTLLGPLVSGGSVVMPTRFSTSKFWGWIERNQCTWFSVVPTQISYLLRDAAEPKHLPNLRFGRSASAPLSPDVHGTFEKTFKIPLIETMGLTETAAQILSNPMPPGQRKLGSPGLPVGVALRVVNAEGDEVPGDSEGELLIRGDSVMQRYFRNPEATDATFHKEAWLRTGDLGRVDSDGYVFITGRLKELIIKGGENIAPREIDDALYSHPDVVEAAAFAVECSDYGQRVEAAVCLKPGSDMNTSQLLGIVENAVGSFKCPDKIYLLDELPKGPSGKIQRNKLCDMNLGSLPSATAL